MKALHVDAGWDDIDTEKILDSCKGVITVFTVVQATAKKLLESESRSAVVKGVVKHAKASSHWQLFSDDLVAEIEAFQKDNDVDDVPVPLD